MVEYNKVNVKLSDSQLNKLKMFEGKNLPHELLLTTRQKTRLKMHLEIICQLI